MVAVGQGIIRPEKMTHSPRNLLSGVAKNMDDSKEIAERRYPKAHGKHLDRKLDSLKWKWLNKTRCCIKRVGVVQ